MSSYVHPLNRFKSGVLQQPPGVSLECIQPFRKSRQSEGNIWSDQAHLLVMQMPFLTHHRHWQQHALFAAEKVSQRFIIQARLKTRPPNLESKIAAHHGRTRFPAGSHPMSGR